ncbi:MAG: hypothetical protein R2850_13095 [Bacteroidia bacterium]
MVSFTNRLFILSTASIRFSNPDIVEKGGKNKSGTIFRERNTNGGEVFNMEINTRRFTRHSPTTSLFPHPITSWYMALAGQPFVRSKRGYTGS